jgi:hypothetical protein
MPIRSTDWEKRRVSILCLRPGGDLQMISATMLMQKHKPRRTERRPRFTGRRTRCGRTRSTASPACSMR